MRLGNSLAVVLVSVVLGLLVAATGSASTAAPGAGGRIVYSGTFDGKRGLIVIDGDGSVQRLLASLRPRGERATALIQEEEEEEEEEDAPARAHVR